MSGKHIQKLADDSWEYPDHKKLLLECGLFPINTYIERRRGTLRRYLDENRRELMEETVSVRKHCKDVNKVLWWEQEHV